MQSEGYDQILIPFPTSSFDFLSTEFSPYPQKSPPVTDKRDNKDTEDSKNLRSKPVKPQPQHRGNADQRNDIKKSNHFKFKNFDINIQNSRRFIQTLV